MNIIETNSTLLTLNDNIVFYGGNNAWISFANDCVKLYPAMHRKFT